MKTAELWTGLMLGLLIGLSVSYFKTGRFSVIPVGGRLVKVNSSTGETWMSDGPKWVKVAD